MYICQRTKFTYQDVLYIDDIGKTPFSIYTYFFSECRSMRWANERVRFSYLLGIGGGELIGYQFRDDQVGRLDIFNVPADFKTNPKVEKVKTYEMYRATNFNNYFKFEFHGDINGLRA